MKKLENRIGKIVTFYSYKGGVGRSMALANIAVLLANWGYRTLVIDWDLEAPGLENFFKKYLSVADAKSKPGLIDILSGETTARQEKTSWRDCLITVNIREEATSLFVDNKLFLITSGKVDDDYYKRVRDFDFNDFYLKHNGGHVIDNFRAEWKSEFDFILIDSRTGVTDIGGVCTVQLPDMLVLLFTPTDQGFEGILRVAVKALEGRKKLPETRMKLLRLPIPTRMDNTESDLNTEWIRKFEIGLETIYAPWLPKTVDRNGFLLKTKVPYTPFFSFGEGLPVAAEGNKDPSRMGYAYEGIAALVAKQLNNAAIFSSNREDFIRSAINPDIDLDQDDIKQSYHVAEKNLKMRESELTNSLGEVEKVKKRQKRITWIIAAVFVVTGALMAGYLFERPTAFNHALVTAKIKDSLIKVHKRDSVAKLQVNIGTDSGGMESLPRFNSIKQPGKTMGMDISRFNQVTDWDRVKAVGISFVLIKATEGSDHTDTSFAKNWAGAKSNRLIRGAYHYFTNRAAVSVQAKNFLSSVHLQSGDLPPILDLDGADTKTKVNDVKSLLDSLEAYYKVKPIIYSPYTYAKVLAKDERFAQYPLWVGIYGPNNDPTAKQLLLAPKWPPLWQTWTFWQFTTEGVIDGVINRGGVKLDLDQYNGTYEQLKSLTMP